VTTDLIDWRSIWRVVAEHRRELLVAQGLAILAALMAVPVPLLLPLLVDEVLLQHPGLAVYWMDVLLPAEWRSPLSYILALMGLTLLLRILAALFNVLQTRAFSLISKDIIYRIRCRLIRRLERIAMSEYESLGSGSVITHMVTDLDTVDQFIGATVSKTLVALLTLTGTAIVLLWMNWRLALFILLLNPLVIILTRRLGRRVKELKRQENTALGSFQLLLSEVLEGIHQIRASHREHHYMGRLSDKALSVREHSAAYAWKSDAAGRMSFLVFLTGFDLFRGLALLMVVYSDLTLGEMMAVSGYLWFMMAPVQDILGMQVAYYGAKGALERLNQFCRRQQEPNYPHHQNPFLGKTTVGLSVKDLSFSYGSGLEVLHSINLEVAPGERVALVGASGGGKSTLIQLLIGLYPLSKGMIAFDGVAIDQIGLDVVRENVVTVLQHPVLFNDSVRANVTLGRTADDAAIWHALEVAQLREVIEASPRGLDAMVGRLGVRLSGGQRQRLALARMVLQDPKVVILDEATSALDNLTEARLYQSLERFLADRTTLIVAHRLSAIRHADRILVFEDGHLHEEGTHEALMERRGLYATFFGAGISSPRAPPVPEERPS